MKTLFNETDRRAILERIERLMPQQAPEWGSMSAQRMVCHLGVAFAGSFGYTFASAELLVAKLACFAGERTPAIPVLRVPPLRATMLIVRKASSAS